jgi:hypothetical protein
MSGAAGAGAGAADGAGAGADEAEFLITDDASARKCIGDFLATRQSLADMTKLAAPIRKKNRQRQKVLQAWMEKAGKKTCYANSGRTEIALVQKKQAYNFRSKLDTDERRKVFLRIIQALPDPTPKAIASAFNTQVFEAPPVDTVTKMVCKDSEYGKAMKKLEAPKGDGTAEMSAQEKADVALGKIKAAIEAPDHFAA